MGVQFERPLLLAALVPCLALIFYLWLTSHGYMPPVRRVLALVLRASVVSLLILALSGPEVQLGAREIAIGVLLDRSNSISPAAQADQEQWLAQLLASKSS